mgnify:CR=1 FL=1
MKFMRSDTRRHLRLGKRNKKLQKWRKPRGRHNKIRRKRFGYPLKPSPGFKTPIKHSGLVQGLKPVLVHNLKELDKAHKNSIIIIARIGAKKKIEILKKAQELKLKIANAGGSSWIYQKRKHLQFLL